jgi:hypothetical protein
MTPVLTFGQRQQAMQGLPFYGKGDFNFIASRSNFSSGISIKILPLSDLSRVQAVPTDEFEKEIRQLGEVFKKGSRISGVKVNSTFTNKNHKPDHVIGKFEGLKIDRKQKTIRAFIRDPKDMKIIEVYPETLERLNESKSQLNESKSYLAKTFLDFVI